MRYTGRALIASAVVLAACAGGGDKPADSTATTSTTTTTQTTAAATMMAITGTTHEVKMLGDAQGYRFDPVDITIKAGDGLKFVTLSGQPHNVAFNAADIPDNVEAQLNANMEKTESLLMSPMIMAANETFTISFAGIPPGKYPFNCPVHLALGMKGSVTVQ